MIVMIYHGRVKDGRIEFDNVPPLADGTEVRIEPVGAVGANGAPERGAPSAKSDQGSVLDQLRSIVGAVEMPPDFAARHNEYRRRNP